MIRADKILFSIAIFVFFLTMAIMIPDLTTIFFNFEEFSLKVKMGWALACVIAGLSFLIKPLYQHVNQGVR